MPIQYIVATALAAGLASLLLILYLRSRRESPNPIPAALLLEEAIVTEPIAPGMEGRAEIRKGDAEPLALRVRASDPGQAFARGAKVRVIDFREGCCFIENADEEHLVR